MVTPRTRSRPALRILPALLVLLGSGSAVADELWLDNGRRLEGKVSILADGRVEVLASGSRWVLSGERVLRIAQRESLEEAVEAALAKLPATDAQSRFELAGLCQARGAATLAQRLLRQVLALEPGHEGARGVLGYERLEGQWLTREQIHAAKGEVFFRDRWLSAGERERILAWETAQAAAAAAAMRAESHAAELAAREARLAQAEQQALKAPTWQGFAWSPFCCASPRPLIYWPTPIPRPRPEHPSTRPLTKPPLQPPVEPHRSRVAPASGG